ncbi:MAG TPA: ATP-binding protein [Acidimicrobiia bacterium]|nr:ATP-binding protein [Acidimicrobiia bacterium]
MSRPPARFRTGGVSLRRRVGIAFLTIGALGVVALAFTAVTFGGLLDARSRLVGRLDPAVLAGRDLRGALVDQETGVRGFALTAGEPFLDPYNRGRSDETAASHRLQNAIRRERRLTTALAGTLQRAEEWRQTAAEPLIASVRIGGPKAATPALLEESRQRFDAFRDASKSMEKALDTERARASTSLDTATRRLVEVAAAGMLAAALAGLVLWRSLGHWVLGPLDSLGEQTRRVTAGEFDRPIEPVGPPEIMRVAGDTEGMRRRIRAELGAMEDAREQLAAQAEELARSNADLEQFAYVASHDLQEPLRKVTSFCQLLQRRYQGELDERADQYIEFAVDGAKRMQALINDLLAFSRVGRTTEAFTEVDCDWALERALRNLETAIDDAGAEVISSGLPSVDGDPSLLTALFQNLVGNAIKFRADAPPRVEVSAHQVDGEWSFRVADNGIGIEEAYAERVFVIFQRLHAKELYPGTGIGLALCKKIVEFHGGRIWLDTAVSSGTTVCWTLPVPEPASPVPDEEALPAPEEGEISV